MQDPLQRHIEKLKIMRESAKRRSEMYTDISKLDDKNTTRSLKALTKAPAPGNKISKIGFIMLWIPEPTCVTCAVGAPMILAGRYLDKKYNGSTLKDIGEHTKEIMTSINNFKTHT